MNTTEFENLQGFGRGNSNGLISFLFTMGFVGMLIISVPFFINLKKGTDNEKNTKARHLLYIIILLLSNMSEPIMMTPLTILLLAKEYAKCLPFRRIYLNEKYDDRIEG